MMGLRRKLWSKYSAIAIRRMTLFYNKCIKSLLLSSTWQCDWYVEWAWPAEIWRIVVRHEAMVNHVSPARALAAGNTRTRVSIAWCRPIFLYYYYYTYHCKCKQRTIYSIPRTKICVLSLSSAAKLSAQQYEAQSKPVFLQHSLVINHKCML